MLLLRINAATVEEHSLSITLRLMGILLCCRVSMMLLKAVAIAASFFVGIGRARMALISYMYATNMYTLFRKDHTGKVPVKSVYIVPGFSPARTV